MSGRPIITLILRHHETPGHGVEILSGLFEAGITPTVFEADRETWVARIHDALENDLFVLHAQPIVDLATGATVQHELLLRLRVDDEQLIAPLAFLPTAERSGLIGAIDQWVIRRAIRRCST